MMAAEDDESSHASIESIFSLIYSLIDGFRFDSVVHVARSEEQVTVTYHPMDVSPYFRDIVGRAHACLFTGGTMKPREYLLSVLASVGKPLAVEEYPHVIDAENVLCLVVPALGGQKLILNHQHAAELDQHLDKLFQLIAAIDPTVEGGLVVFFTSYSVMNRFKQAFSRRLDSLRRKAFFDGPDALRDFSKCVLEKAGAAALFSVMGGSLSEGINFKDRLCRCVIAVGLPYPNSQSDSVRLKMKYLDSKKAAGFSGRDYYTGLCMKTLNQTVGRAVRHQADYAAVVLFDERFDSEPLLQLMPAWIVRGRQAVCSLEAANGQLARFASRMRAKYSPESN
jgi:chromosome transmission fidelity protein 1